MTTGRRRNARGEGGQLREDILRAAIALIEHCGSAEALSLRAVAKEVGIAAPSVYPHFEDRDQLLIAILQHLFDELIAIRTQAEDAAAAAGGGAWERLRAAIFATVRFGLDRPGHYRMLYEGRVVSSLSDPKAATFGRAIQVRVIALIQQILSLTPGREVEDAERLSLLLWASVHGVISLQINKPTLAWPDATALVEDLMHALLRPS
ncbi:TetR/AcrR family transcriptional regulator [Nitrospirillum sp. BR 11163]|uniref:TetR/AcrR family transcriptional regulator n=1 Tax=Nitrospirillum sp. BR 11163 TaxID=3104323 RepID=UPI002AFEBCAA|nr:TetR/AcrR family transcriptional regulator [Nitrospirillum sp. BR 11163]MEA1672294.1 TetR/AcrR family transcriptional regulator [Nitrospirillum sp. BR 11163]